MPGVAHRVVFYLKIYFKNGINKILHAMFVGIISPVMEIFVEIFAKNRNFPKFRTRKNLVLHDTASVQLLIKRGTRHGINCIFCLIIH